MKRIIATVPMAGTVIYGEYWGGEYITLSFPTGEPFDVINVWDYESGKPRIPLAYSPVFKAMVEYRDDAGEYLGENLANHRESLRI